MRLISWWVWGETVRLLCKKGWRWVFASQPEAAVSGEPGYQWAHPSPGRSPRAPWKFSQPGNVSWKPEGNYPSWMWHPHFMGVTVSDWLNRYKSPLHLNSFLSSDITLQVTLGVQASLWVCPFKIIDQLKLIPMKMNNNVGNEDVPACVHVFIV